MSHGKRAVQYIARGSLTHAHMEWDGSWYIEVNVNVDDTAPHWGRSIFGFFVPSVGGSEIGDTIVVVEEFNGKCYIRENNA